MRTLLLPLAILALASAAGAATLSVVPDQLTYTIGDTVTLTVIGDDEDVPFEEYSLFGRLVYGAALTQPVSVNQTRVGTAWILGANVIGDGFAQVFDQLTIAGGIGDLLAPGGSPFSTVTLIAEAVGIVDVDW